MLRRTPSSVGTVPFPDWLSVPVTGARCRPFHGGDRGSQAGTTRGPDVGAAVSAVLATVASAGAGATSSKPSGLGQSSGLLPPIT
jgi:hypothetical protein